MDTPVPFEPDVKDEIEYLRPALFVKIMNRQGKFTFLHHPERGAPGGK